MVFGYAQNYYFHLRECRRLRSKEAPSLIACRPPQEQRTLRRAGRASGVSIEEQQRSSSMYISQESVLSVNLLLSESAGFIIVPQNCVSHAIQMAHCPK